MKLNESLKNKIPSLYKNMSVEVSLNQQPKEGQRSKEWFEKRKGRFTASRIHEIITTKDYLTKGGKTYVEKQIWNESLIEEEEIEDSVYSGISQMDRGVELEPEAIEFYEKSTGIITTESDFLAWGDFSGGSTDANIFIDDKIDGILEVKCPKGYYHLKWGQLNSAEDLKKAKPQYYWQNMANLMFTGANWCDFVSYHPNCSISKLFILRIYPNEEDFEIIKKSINLAAKYRNKVLSTVNAKPKYF